MDKAFRKDKFASKGSGVSTYEHSINFDKFILVNSRIYSIKILVQAVKKDWFQCPGGHIECAGVELLFHSEVSEFIGFDSAEDRDYFFMYLQRWLFDDETFNVLSVNYYSKKENNEDN